MYFCARCRTYTFATTCFCTSFEVIHEGYHDKDDPHTVWASDDGSAAEAYAKHYNEDSCEYSMMNGDSPIEITVNGKEFIVSAEPCINYHAEEK